ncbi:MAG: hypothetical protein U5L09_19785 [Bacteroidales bacterium]|nr:hypothetical protein [Bacteroidales bacterium]
MKTILILITIFLASCEDNSNNIVKCYDDNPIEELTWLNELIEDYSISTTIITPSIIEYLLYDSVYFAIEQEDGINKIYNCSGSIYCSIDSIDQPCLEIFKDNAIEIKKIWPE